MKIVVDTSALIAILRSEDGSVEFATMLGSAVRSYISTGTLLEAGIVTARSGDEADRLNQLVQRTQLEVVPVSAAEAQAGVAAFKAYGRGSGHVARLNFGDCFAYALARTRGLPLLFKGDDFIHTDIEPALKPAREFR